MGVPKTLKRGQRSRDRPLFAAEEARLRGLRLFSKQFLHALQRLSPFTARRDRVPATGLHRPATRLYGRNPEAVDEQTSISLGYHGGYPPRKPNDLPTVCITSVASAVRRSRGPVVAQLDGPIGIERVAL